jgi:hypothetical protein
MPFCISAAGAKTAEKEACNSSKRYDVFVDYTHWFIYVYIYMYVSIHTNIYIYIYIYDDVGSESCASLAY